MNHSGEPDSASNPLAFLLGGGEMGSLIRSMDWSETSLGPVADWPQSLRTTVSICLASDLPICVIWGPGLVQLYNDAYRVICGNKHPRSMGQNFAECWKEAWPVIGEAHDSALAGDTAFLEAQHIFLERRGYVEETFFTFSFSPIRDEAGRVGGLFHPVIEMTTKMLSERRIRTLRDLSAQTSKAKSVSEALALAAQALADYDLDLPFVLLYALDSDGDQARLVGVTGLTADFAASQSSVNLRLHAQTPWPLEEVARTGQTVLIDDVRQRIGTAAVGPYPEPPNNALVLPIILPGASRPVAIFIAGVSSRLKMNEEYRGFYDLLSSAVTTAVSNARAFDDERRRAAALADLDHAKTAFFANVSHEFRTPLTLMLGPVEDALSASSEPLPPQQRERLEVVQRNGMRLQRLVNSLLDFSRIEAGRARATFEPTALAAFTADLSSNFRSACDKAGLELRVDCVPLSEPVFVDRTMWETLLLNLLSNAFKFTFEGNITVSLHPVDSAVHLRVSDTGIGVPAEEVPLLFERFHRVESARGRTHEGSGIGLALVKELVKLHGGAVSVDSELGRGTTFNVSIPLGSQHLPQEQIGNSGNAAQPTAGVNAFVEEALRWLPDADQHPALGAILPSWHDDLMGRNPFPRSSDAELPLVLVADDNADMRQYLVRLLGAHYRTEAVPNGEAALAAVRERIPDLIVADVMMPLLDGFGLLQALRSDLRTNGVPVVILSARAGEESRIEGMLQGADDYLVKPFSGRELLARVSAHLHMARIRRESTEAIQASEDQFRALVKASSDVVYRMNADWSELRQLEGRKFVADSHEPNRSWLEKYIHPDDQRRVMETIREALRTKGTFELEHQVLRIDGTLGWTFSRAVPLMDNDGTVVEWMGMASDVTARKQGEEERERLVVRLQEQDQRKDEFLAMLAHELRNPLAPISAAADLLRLTVQDAARVKQTSEIISRQVSHMSALVEDLLDVSRVTGGLITLDETNLDVKSVVSGALEQVRPLIEARRHHLSVHLSPETALVKGDANRLIQVVVNLLNNAAKYTPEGGNISLTLETDEKHVAIRVTDNGIGMTPNVASQAFELFTQAERTPDRSQGGLGIGLAVVDGLVKLHGGKIMAHSAGLGLGSEFTFWLPRLENRVSSEKENLLEELTLTAATRALKIMVVDDNVDAAEMLAMLVEALGHQVIIEHGSKRALKRAMLESLDVCLLDIGLPDMDGNELARRLRSQPEKSACVLIAVTGYGLDADRKNTLAAGFDHHLVKPVDAKLLASILAQIKSN